MIDFDDMRRKQLGEFLKIRRSKVSPEQAGLQPTKRRRTPGLRREEVAELAGISPDWYTRLEQGRNIQVSSAVLYQLAEAFQLDSNEQKHLFSLAQLQVPLENATDKNFISPMLQNFLDTQGCSPAYITNVKWDIVAWNKAACAVFGDYEVMSARDRNVLWRAFTSSEMKNLLEDWDGHAKKRIAQFRASYAQLYNDPWWNKIVNELMEISDVFKIWWKQYDVLNVPEGTKIVHHPVVGDLQLGHLSFRLCDSPDMIVTVHIPTNQNSVDKIKTLLGNISNSTKC